MSIWILLGGAHASAHNPGFELAPLLSASRLYNRHYGGLAFGWGQCSRIRLEMTPQKQQWLGTQPETVEAALLNCFLPFLAGQVESRSQQERTGACRAISFSSVVSLPSVQRLPLTVLVQLLLPSSKVYTRRLHSVALPTASWLWYKSG